jgi:hypothetical protein
MDTDPASGNVAVSSEFAAAVVALPNELLYGAQVEPTLHGRAPALRVVACDADSICERAGFGVGDYILGFADVDVGVFGIEVADSSGNPRTLIVEVEP